MMIFVVLLMSSFVGTGEPLQLVDMTVPDIADPRDDVTLTCHFDMGMDRLYSVKWYKDEQEFFRYTPASSPPTINFTVGGVHLAPSFGRCNTSQCPIKLTRLGTLTTGAYKCEVSTEKPTFFIVHQTANMTVAALPRRDPIIHGLSEHYSVGDMVQANCTTDKSEPAAQIIWYINDEKAHNSLMSIPVSSPADDLGLVSRSVSLHMPAERRLFLGPSAVLRLRCVARILLVRSSPQPRQASASATLFTAHAQLRNQKLAWPINAGSSTHDIVSLQRMTTGNLVLIVSFLFSFRYDLLNFIK